MNIFSCVRRLAPIASQARHFPPHSGEADTKEKSNQVLYSKNKNKEMTHTKKAVPACFVAKEFCCKSKVYKPQAVPGHGEGGGEAVGRGKREQK